MPDSYLSSCSLYQANLWGIFYLNTIIMGKKDAYYFSHDSNARNDIKIVKLRRVLGMEGYGVYFAIIEMLREQKDNRLPLSSVNEISFELHVSEEKVKSIIVGFDLFSIDGETFFSERLLRSMVAMGRRKKALSDAGKRGNLTRWQNVGNQTNISPPDKFLSPGDPHPIALKETKVKENSIGEDDAGKPAPKPKNLLDDRRNKFYKDLADRVPEYGKTMVRAFYDYWSEPNKSKTKMRWELEKTWDLHLRLKKWRDNDDKWSKPITKPFPQQKPDARAVDVNKILAEREAILARDKANSG